MNILLIGQTTLHWGRMEFGNIGNYYIIEPFIRELHRVFPDATIKTTLQMSDQFCMSEKLDVLPMNLYYGFTKNEIYNAKSELNLVNHFERTGKLVRTTPYIDAVLESDIVIDFSGDIWGENANFLGKDRFEVGLIKDLIAQKLGKPTFMIAGSPGPFIDNKLKKIAKEAFQNFSLVTNREPISTEILESEGFKIDNVRNLACPAFIFEPHQDEKIIDILRKENLLLKTKPIIGFIICGWNFNSGPFDKWPRDDKEYFVFAELIEFITNHLNAKVVLMSHSNGFDVPPKKFKLLHGRDYPIIKQLQKVLLDRNNSKDVHVLDDIYDPWTTKAIIRHFDVLISGRVHGAVAGLSQTVPTVIIDYGHEPKAHKLRGFARVTNMEDYLVDPQNASDLIDVVSKCWKEKDNIRMNLQRDISYVKNLSRENFNVIKEFLDMRRSDVIK